jgi:CHASE2 domain-containing sensor protein
LVTLKRKLRESWRAAAIGGGLAMVLGVVLLVFGSGNQPGRSPGRLQRWSYDLPFLFRPQIDITNLAIIYMDDASHLRLQQPYDKPWNRTNHAKLVRSLTEFGVTAIAFDVLMDVPSSDPNADAELAQAIRSHGRVVLAADLGSGDYFGGEAEIKPIRPDEKLLAGADDWGLGQLNPDNDDCVRKHFAGFEYMPSLSWRLASMVGADATKPSNAQRLVRWLNYYGGHETIPHVSYHKVIGSSRPELRNFFQGRVVFVGSATQSGFSGKRRDQFHSPYSGWGESLWPGVDFHATQFLNLARGDWLRTPPPLVELGLIALCGLAAGTGLALLRPVTAVWVAVAAAAIVGIAACVVVWQTHVWFAWMIIVAVQIPVALASSVVQVAQTKSVALNSDMTAEFPRAPAVAAAGVPDYEMLRQIGTGSYGQVWLARSVTGIFRAVKIVDWKSPNDSRFEREFEGLKKFEPISRSHQGLVDILHVGRNDAARHLYYVMELADSCGSNPEADPDNYVPATLKMKMNDGPIKADECARISLMLTSALAFLHEQGLIHRDIKPSNIIFVAGEPKLADIGLVAAADETLSFVGTEGYIPPEGPGTPTADVFSLGRVLSELIARTRRESQSETFEALKQVIERACSRSAGERYKTATEMLVGLQIACKDSRNSSPVSAVPDAI